MSKPVRNEPLLDLAVRHNVSPETIRRAIRLGMLEGDKKKGAFRLNEDEFIAWRDRVNARKNRRATDQFFNQNIAETE